MNGGDGKGYEYTEEAVWNSLNTEPKLVTYAYLNMGWQSTDQICSGFMSGTGYQVEPVTIENYLRSFSEAGFVNRQGEATGDSESVARWQLTPEGSVVRPVTSWLIKYIVEHEISMARYIGKEFPYETLNILEMSVLGSSSYQCKQAIEVAEPGVREHFRRLREDGIIDMEHTMPKYGPSLEDFITEAVIPAKVYLMSEQSGDISYPMDLFAKDKSLARHYQRTAIDLYLLKGSGLNGSMDIGPWMRKVREKKMSGREYERQSGYSSTFISLIERNLEKPGRDYISKFADIFGMNADIMWWISRRDTDKPLLDVVSEDPKAVGTLLRFDQAEYGT